MALPEFKDEAEFREQWLKPFLRKLGYIVVTHTHGSGEQGKDFFFADFDRFEHLRFYACQAKKGDIGAGSTELLELWNQVDRAFTVSLRHHKTAQNRNISAVYVVTTGKISEMAREYISDHCRMKPYGENVYFIDGERLELFNRFATHRDDMNLRERLLGLWGEMQFNLSTLQQLQELCGRSEERTFTVQKCRLSAMENALTYPPPQQLLSYDLIQNAWNLCQVMNGRCELRTQPLADPKVRSEEILGGCPPTIDAVLKVRDGALAAIEKLDEQYNLGVAVLPDEQ
jgi:hypothetical protein